MQLEPVAAHSPVAAKAGGGPQVVSRQTPSRVATVRWSDYYPDADARHVVANLRAVDRYEALSFGHDPATDDAYLRASILSLCFYWRDEPTFILGALEDVPGVFSIWGFGTDDTPHVIRTISRVCRKHVVHELFGRHGARRLEVRLPYNPMCEPNIEWLRRIGFHDETISEFATVDDEPVLTLAVTKADYRRYVSSET